MTTIAHFGTAEDRSYLPRLREIIGAHDVKCSAAPEEYLASIAAKVKANKIEAIICTCSVTMLTLLKALPDFRRPITANGRDKALTLDDYAGSFFTLPAHKLGTPNDLQVLVLNPLAHLVRTPEGPFIFKRFISKITRPGAWFPQTAFTWELWTAARSDMLLAKFKTAKLLAIDIETRRGCPYRSISCVGYAALFPDGTTHTVVVPFEDMLAHSFVRQLNQAAPAKIFQNGLYDNLYFLRWGVPCTNWLYDTQHLFHSWYSELPKRLDFITAFSVREIRFWKDDAKTGGKHELYEYNARDCWATLTSWCSLVNEIPTWARTNYLMEFPLVFPCLHMEADGLSLDRSKFDLAKAEAEVKLEVQRKKLVAWLGDKFNPGSPDQCKRLLKVLGMGEVESADAKNMVACASIHPLNELIVSAILAYRKQAKLISTYLNWDKFWNDRLYYKTNPAGTDTGRMASTESSFWTGLQIQNIPQGNAVKSWIRADDGWDGIAEGDKAQAEARCVGYLSGCKALIDLVESDKDYHSWNAHKFFGVAYEAVTKALRNLSKRVNHGANYNMGAQVLLDTMGPKNVAEARILLGLPAKWTLIQICQHLLNTYATTYPEVKKDWYTSLQKEISITKKLVSPSGWTRYFFSDPRSSKPAMNAAVAHGPQHLNAAILNTGFYKLWLDTVYGDLRGRVRLKAQIHDSVLFCWKGEEVPDLVRSRMETSLPVKGADNVVRTMLIPSDMSWRKHDKEGNDAGPARYWSDMK